MISLEIMISMGWEKRKSFMFFFLENFLKKSTKKVNFFYVPKWKNTKITNKKEIFNLKQEPTRTSNFCPNFRESSRRKSVKIGKSHLEMTSQLPTQTLSKSRPIWSKKSLIKGKFLQYFESKFGDQNLEKKWIFSKSKSRRYVSKSI